MGDCRISIPCFDIRKKIKGPIRREATPYNHNILEFDNHTQCVRLIDINTEKDSIACITEYKPNNDRFFGLSPEDSNQASSKFFLTISKFRGEQSEVESISYEVTNVVIGDQANACMFLSISPDSKRIAISYVGVNGNKIGDPDCCILEVSNDKEFLTIRKTIDFQGRAVFSKNNELMLINTKILEIYNKDLHKTTFYDLTLFNAGKKIETRGTIVALQYMLRPRWAWFMHVRDDIDGEVKDIITMSRQIRHNILIMPYATKAQVWSIAEKGVRLTSIIKQKDEEIMAFSKNYKYLATFVNSTEQVNVYNVKSGLFLYKLTPRYKTQGDRSFEVTYIRFCLDERYLIMTGLEKRDTREVAVRFEVWHIESEQSIRSIRRDGDLSIKGNKTIAPFAMIYNPRDIGNRPTLMRHGQSSRFGMEETISVSSKNKIDQISIEAEDSLNRDIYAFYVEYNNDITHIRELKINVYNSQKTDEAVDMPSDHRWIKATSNNLPDISLMSDTSPSLFNRKQTICFIRNYDGRSYLLQFGKYLIQMWRLPKDVAIPLTPDIRDNLGELLFIHAYKAPYYGFTNTFREAWVLKDNSEDSIWFMQHDNNIDRIVVDITMDTNDLQNMSGSSLSMDIQQSSGFCAEVFIPFKEIVNPFNTFSGNSLHLYLKSACQALHYLNDLRRSLEKLENVMDTMSKVEIIYKATQRIIMKCVGCIEFSNPAEYKYFSTIIGSNMLAMLASFRDGHAILFHLLKIKKLPVSLFSYAQKMTEEEEKENLSTNENALTILAETMNDELYMLLFNRILSDSRVVGIGSLSALTDVLVYLQETANNELLLSSCQKLSYLSVNMKIVPVLDEEAEYILKMKKVKKNYVPNFKMLKTYSFDEQLSQYENTLYDNIKFKLDRFRKGDFGLYRVMNKFYMKSKLQRYLNESTFNIPLDWIAAIGKALFRSRHTPRKIAVVCIVPLPHFLTYSDFPEDRRNPPNTYSSHEQNVIPNKPESAFIRIASNQNENSIFRQGDTVLRTVLKYKWSSFIRRYFIIMYIVCLVYYICYSVGISFAREVFGYEPGSALTHGGHIACVALALVSDAILIIQEFRQLYHSYDRRLYLFSFYNWIDWSAYLLSIASLSLLLTGAPNFEQVNTFATLFLWLHGILKLRVFEIVGITIEIIVQLIKAVQGILLVLILILFAFTNMFITLLSHKDDAYFQEQYSGYAAFPGSNDSEPNVALVDSSTSNDFGDVFNAFSISWFVMFGVWDPFTSGDAGDNKLIKVIAILFSFLISLIFFNIFIAYMNSAIDDVQKRGVKASISHYAAILAETEQFWCSNSVKHKRKNNPTFIYYIASVEETNNKEESLQKETDALFEKLNARYAYEESIEQQPLHDQTLEEFEAKFKNFGEALLTTAAIPDHIREQWRQTDVYLRERLDFFRNNPSRL